MEAKLYYSVRELTKIANVSRHTVHNWIDKGLLKVVRVDGTIRIHKEEIERLGFEL